MKINIKDVNALEILDSRGNPTIEVIVTLSDGTKGVNKVPSGASTGKFEAYELRDNEERFRGMGVTKAVHNVNNVIKCNLINHEFDSIEEIDALLCKLDGTDNKHRLGANAILGVSLATIDALANSQHVPLYQLIGGLQGKNMPLPMFNVINGGKHADNNLDIQEFMLVPVGMKNIKDGLTMTVEVYHTLKELLSSRSLSVSVGDEGGFAPNLSNDKEALDLLMEAIKISGYLPGKDFAIALDAASSEWKGKEKGVYRLIKSHRALTSNELVEYWKNLLDHYPIISIEDPLDEEDYDGWKKITSELSNRTMLVGDDLFVTNIRRLNMGIENHMANAILIKVNQIGTFSETIDCIMKARQHHYKVIVSHRSGETDDTFCADLAYGVNADFVKFGAPARGERVSKYNRLLEIYQMQNKNKPE